MLNEILDIAKEAGVIALEHQKKLTTDIKKDKSIVTNGDLAVSAFLEEKLAKFYPVLSEENYNLDVLKNTDKVFVIDPIDGTISYSRKDESWSILISIVDVKTMEPELGVVYQPTTGKLYYAEKGKGAYLVQDKSVIKLDRKRQEVKKVIMSPTEVGGDIESYVSNIKERMLYFGAGMKFALIAEGEADLYLSLAQKCSLWDIFAGWIILKEVGGDFYLPKGISLSWEEPLIDSSFYAAVSEMELDGF